MELEIYGFAVVFFKILKSLLNFCWTKDLANYVSTQLIIPCQYGSHPIHNMVI